jgi:hypothetical protein
MTNTFDQLAKLDLNKILTDDIEIMDNIDTYGVHFLEFCYKNINVCEKYKNVIDNYHLHYIEGIIFTDSTKKYIDNMITNKYLWHTFVTKCSIDKNVILKLLDNINTSDYTLVQYSNIYNTLFHIKIENIIIETLTWEHNIKSLNNTIFYKMISLINNKNENIWDHDIETVANFFVHIMKFINIRDKVIKWFSHTLNLSIGRKNVKSILPLSFNSDIVMMNITGILYKILNSIKIPNNVNTTYIQLINHKYVYDKNCELSWYTNKHTNNRYNLITKIFFLLSNSVCVSYIPILEYNKILDVCEKDIRMFPESIYQIMPLKIQKQMFAELDKIETLRKENLLLVNNNKMKLWITDYFNNVCEWIYNYKAKEFGIDDILESYILFLEKFKEKQLGDNNKKLLFDILGNKSITANPDLRISVLKLLYNIFTYSIPKNEQFDIMLYIKSIFVLHNDLKLYNREQKYNIKDRTCMYKIINCIIENTELFKYLNIDRCYMIEELIQQLDILSIKTFVNILFNDMTRVNELYEQTENILINESTTNIARKKSIYEYLNSQIYLLKNMFDMISCMILSTTFSKNLQEKDFIILMSPMNFILNKINDYKFSYPYKLDNKKDVDEKLRNICIIAINIYSIIFNNKNGPNIVISSYSNFNIETCENMCKQFNNYVDQSFIKFIDKCNDIIKLMESKNNIEYPDEFLDVLIGTVIEDPVWLPNTTEEEILDKSTVIKCLIDKSKNPFTGEPLDIIEFEEYNNTDEIKQRATEFKKKMLEWQKNNL